MKEEIAMKKVVEFFYVDAFTTETFGGNPVALYLMQKI